MLTLLISFSLVLMFAVCIADTKIGRIRLPAFGRGFWLIDPPDWVMM